MSRFLCSTLLLLFVLPLFAQEEPMVPERQPLPRGNQAVLLRMRQQLTQELQQLQRMIDAINPSDTQFLNLLQAQQTELTKQMKDITQQLEGSGLSGEPSVALSDTPNSPLPPAPAVQEPELPKTPMGTQPGRFGGGMSQMVPLTQPNPYPEMPPYPPGMGMSGNVPWVAGQTLDSSPWAPKPSKELLELKQAVESLRTEVAELKETIKTLETQIQLLNRNILLSEKAKEQ